MAETKTAVGVEVSSPWSGGVRPFAINSKKFGMWLFIVSDTLTFSALLLAYSYSRLSNPNWPRPFEIYPAIAKSTSMTLVLLASSLTMVLGVAAAHRNDRAKAVRWLLLTALGGVALLVVLIVTRIRLHPLIALLVVSITVGIFAGMDIGSIAGATVAGAEVDLQQQRIPVGLDGAQLGRELRALPVHHLAVVQ